MSRALKFVGLALCLVTANAALAIISPNNLDQAKALWLTPETIAINIPLRPSDTIFLHVAFGSPLQIKGEQVVSSNKFSLQFEPTGLSPILRQSYPHLAKLSTLNMRRLSTKRLAKVLKADIGVAVYRSGRLLLLTRIQTGPILDHQFSYSGELGFNPKTNSLKLWAPTATKVFLRIYHQSGSSQEKERILLRPQLRNGTWQTSLDKNIIGQFYLFEVHTFSRELGDYVINLVTDPYSMSLSANSKKSQFVDLNSPSLQPFGWNDLSKPVLRGTTDAAIYEIHLRDFSSNDLTVSAKNRGKFVAFTEGNSNGMQHLRAMAKAGISHVHLLPVFDLATIEEVASSRHEVADSELALFPANSQQQQQLISNNQQYDAYNWGYDPLHYTVPEGSYSTNPEGEQRIIEFRRMVQALNKNGLRMVMDVAYNHTAASGQNRHSILDRVVPGYYHRYDLMGKLETSTCCANTASERSMMEKLMIDSLKTWAIQYKVDGFRFDLMGHHLRDNLIRIRAALDALTLEEHGVNGREILMYGEGWDFGELVGGRQGANASQFNMAGTGIGTFNDRLRDAVRGGSPFGNLRAQGFASGLFMESNSFAKIGQDKDLNKLMQLKDIIRASLAGNLKDYRFENYQGRQVMASEIQYNGKSAAYAGIPADSINYVSAHDNETLFDSMQIKSAATTPLSARIELHQLATGLGILAQGVPFIHAGQELLRSKSLDRNSYNSAVWYNRLDFSFENNNWGVGLPLASDNGQHWPFFEGLLANIKLRVGSTEIIQTREVTKEFLRLRQSSRLFRLSDPDEIKQKIRFHNTGPNQIAGLIAMSINDGPQQIVVLINAAPKGLFYTPAGFASSNLKLHPVLAASVLPRIRGASFDKHSKTFWVPRRSVTVYTIP